MKTHYYLIFKNEQKELDYFSGTYNQVTNKVKALSVIGLNDWEIQSSQEEFNAAYEYFKTNPQYLNL